jgi:hypothetical protein
MPLSHASQIIIANIANACLATCTSFPMPSFAIATYVPASQTLASHASFPMSSLASIAHESIP